MNFACKIPLGRHNYLIMLANKLNAVKNYARDNRGDLFIALSFFLIALIGFGLGRLSYVLQEKEPLKINKADFGSMSAAVGSFVASKNGSNYYLPSCAGVSRIKEENKIWFSSKEEAEGLGYKPASNCPGL